MLKTKKYKEELEPLDSRVDAVKRFLGAFKRGLVIEVTKGLDCKMSSFM